MRSIAIAPPREASSKAGLVKLPAVMNKPLLARACNAHRKSPISLEPTPLFLVAMGIECNHNKVGFISFITDAR